MAYLGRKENMREDIGEFHQATMTLLGPVDGYWTQALVRHHKDAARDGTRVLILKRFGKYKAA